MMACGGAAGRYGAPLTQREWEGARTASEVTWRRCF